MTRQIALLGALLSGVLGVGLSAVGCSSDDSTANAGDAGGDGTAEASNAGDAGDAGKAGDAGGGGDSGDSGRNGDVLNAIDSSDAADGSDSRAADAFVAVDGGPNVFQQYSTQYANAICTGFATCCGATFDVARCKVAFATQGYAATLPQNPTTYNKGNLTFNQTQATACIAALQAWPCGAMITSAQNNAIITACHGVLGGTIPVGGTGCISSFECLNGYCNAGTCTALVANGVSCTPGNPSESSSIDYQCSQIGAALPAPLICNLYPADGGASSGTGSCAPPKADGVTSLCSDGVTYFSDYACTNGLCNDTSMCGPTATNPTTSFGYCAAYVLDAGGGG